ncbi:MAG: hypothetical protein QOE92_235 [Chloroflexota bacterium]|nr:hypothetical protein [Chloroflexota bacterium]
MDWDSEAARQLVESTDQGVYGVDTDGNATFVNAACLRLFGIEGDPVAEGTNLHELGHHTKADGRPNPKADCPIIQATGRGEACHVENDLFWRTDGTSFPVEYWSFPVRHGGEVVGAVVAFLDTTGRVQARRMLDEQAASVAEQARFPEMNPGPVLRLRLDGSIILANAAAREVFGDELLGRRWQDIGPHMDDGFWDTVLSADDIHYLEADLSDRAFSFAHRRDLAGELVFVYGADITRQKDAERMLAEVARFPEMNPGPVVRCELDTRIILANAAARSVFGGELVGRYWRDLVPGVDDAFLQRVMEGTRPIPLEARVGDRDYVFAHRRDHDGSLVFVFGGDVTEQKQAERALRQGEKMATLGTLAAGVAHELNNPAAATRRSAEQLREAFARLEAAQLTLAATVITPAGRDHLRRLAERARDGAGRSAPLDAMRRSDLEAELEEWLESRDLPDAWEIAPQLVGAALAPSDLDAVEAAVGRDALGVAVAWVAGLLPVYTLLHEIAEGAGRISELVGALKSYSYLGQAPVQEVDLHEGIDNTLVILRHKLKRGIEVDRRYAADMPRVPAYGSELNQVWTNILDNAADALGDSGHIVIHTRVDGDHAVVEIDDDGPGIPEDVQSRVFDPFFTTKAVGHGTGLGMSTSYSIITEKHGGELTLESRPGATRFTIRLPLTPPPAAAEAPSIVPEIDNA